jgi:hypothetical protein
MASSLDLGQLFGAVTEQLSQNKEDLNQADDYNHNHGDNMVEIFSLIKNAVSKKKDKTVSEQLDYASQVVDEKVDSGSAKLYSKGLSSAAESLTGEDLNPTNVLSLVKGLFGAKDEKTEEKTEKKQGGFLGSLLGGLMGQSSESEEDQGIGLDDLLQAGMAFYQSKQDGGDTTQALINALIAASPLGESAHRSQSGSIVASTIMNFAKSFMN